MKRHSLDKRAFGGLKNNKKKIVVGLTGGFGSGKSTVAMMFKSLGAEIVDADKIVHRLIKPGGKIYEKIIRVFGRGVLNKDNTINRRKLSEIVFNNRDSLSILNRLIHPAVIKIIKIKIRTSKSHFIIIDAPLLIETGLLNLSDKLVVVYAKQKQQIERILKRTYLSRADIKHRIGFQLPMTKKIRQADFIIDNSGEISQTRKQVEKIRRQLWKS